MNTLQLTLLPTEAQDEQPDFSCAEITITRLPTEEEQLIELARQGDTAARHRMIESVYNQVQRMARWYYSVYRWASASLDWQDMAQDAYEWMLIRLDTALAKDRPVAYLIGIARHRFQQICDRVAHDPLPPVLSLDDPAPGYDEQKYQHLYQAIEHLPEKQRVIIQRRYGIGTRAPEKMDEISVDGPCNSQGAVSHHCRMGLGSLYLSLRSTYPSYAEDNIPLSENKPSIIQTTVPIADHHRSRLDAAYEALESRMVKITTRTLYHEVRTIHSMIVCAYLRERRVPPPSVASRLDDTYATLQSSQEPVTIRKLAHLSQTSVEVATMYLRQREPERTLTDEQRLEKAAAILQSQGKAVTVTGLAEIAHIDHRKASAYLRRMHDTTIGAQQ
jgi:DNA-directed RNA polymerase specialized sigma24 family protein